MLNLFQKQTYIWRVWSENEMIESELNRADRQLSWHRWMKFCVSCLPILFLHFSSNLCLLLMYAAVKIYVMYKFWLWYSRFISLIYAQCSLVCRPKFLSIMASAENKIRFSKKWKRKTLKRVQYSNTATTIWFYCFWFATHLKSNVRETVGLK